MYCAVSGSFNTVSFPSATVVESLVQVTVVAGPPVEIQVRVRKLGSNVTPSDIVMFPSVEEKVFFRMFFKHGSILLKTVYQSVVHVHS